jgi:hypothetical protein
VVARGAEKAEDQKHTERPTSRHDIGIGGVLALTLISVVVGLALAVAHHLSAARVQRLGARSASAAGLAVILGGYGALFAVVIIILFVLALWTPLNLVAMLITFVVAFSALMVWSIYRLMSKQRSAPPSAGASGV